MTDNIFFISQHNLGMGHFVRTKVLAEYLSKEENINVWHFSGGSHCQDICNSLVKTIQLPVIKRLSTISDEIITKNREDPKNINLKRAAILIDSFNKYCPKIVITEFYPFSQHRLNETVIPLLDHIKSGKFKTKLLCSIRDIPISDRGTNLQRSYVKVNRILKKYYHAVLHHTDPQVVSVSSTPFLGAALEGVKVYTTGFVVQKDCYFSEVESFDYLITSGGGIDGLEMIIKTYDDISKHDPKATIVVVCGPLMKTDDLVIIRDRINTAIVIEKVNDLFPYIKKANRIISMAGYNSTVELVKNKKETVLIPRSNSFEQTMRANAFQNAGCVIHHDFRIGNIVNVFEKGNTTKPVNVDINGGFNSTQIILKLLKNGQ